jgi:UV DNA damage repair endonuclease
MGRVGFCCKYVQPHPKKVFESVEGYNTGTTTVAWLKRQSQQVAEKRLFNLMVGNIEAVRKLVEMVGTLDERLRMVRIGSDVLPVYTQRDYSYFWHLPDVRAYAEKHFAEIGTIARARDVRLSFHPGQFVVLASDNPGIVNNSLEEFEYHADMARWMGYGKSFQDFKINVHISGRQGPQGIIAALQRLSPEARNCITIENDENCWGIDSSLELEKHCALVLDIHHHWIRTGEYIQPSDDRCLRVIDSWRGVRPALHYSISREDYLVEHSTTDMPDMTTLLASGYKKQKLRAHSDFYWNSAVNEWAAGFSKDFDIQCESKCKNLASKQFSELLT